MVNARLMTLVGVELAYISPISHMWDTYLETLLNLTKFVDINF